MATDRPTPSRPPSTSRWISIRQIAEDLSVSSSTAYKWLARGRRGSRGRYGYATGRSGSGRTGTRRG